MGGRGGGEGGEGVRGGCKENREIERKLQKDSRKVDSRKVRTYRFEKLPPQTSTSRLQMRSPARKGTKVATRWQK